MFASHVAGEGEGPPAQLAVRIVVVHILHAVVGVVTDAVRVAQHIFAQCILIAEYGEALIGAPQDLPSDTGPIIVAAIGLPAIDKPRLNFQLGSWENLRADAGKKPGRVRRHIRWLIGPVIKVVVTEQSDIRHKYAGIYIDPVQFVKMITAISLR